MSGLASAFNKQYFDYNHFVIYSDLEEAEEEEENEPVAEEFLADDDDTRLAEQVSSTTSLDRQN